MTPNGEQPTTDYGPRTTDYGRRVHGKPRTSIFRSRSPGVRLASFTLIELLTVVAIIGLLAGLLLPAMSRSRTAAKQAQARATCTGLATAFRAYYNEFWTWPNNTAGAQNVTTNMFSNSRGIVFYEFSRGSIGTANKYLDPWGQPYQCTFDTLLKNQVSDPFSGATINTGVIVWSTGPNNPKSW